jgi:hypothetical protein
MRHELAAHGITTLEQVVAMSMTQLQEVVTEQRAK